MALYSRVVCIVLGMAVAAQAGHICNNGIHYYVEHSMKCPMCAGGSFLRSRNSTCEKTAEMLGCNLFDYANGQRFNRFSDQQVHWPGGVEDLEAFDYTQHSNVPGHETCLSRSNCDEKGEYKYWDWTTEKDATVKCYDRTHTEFNMPDYCSRAIMSELSTVYNGVDRTTSLRAGAKVLFAPTRKMCFWSRKVRGKNAIISSVLGKGHREKACWNHVNDWRLMYCVKYHECTCPSGLTPEECSRHEQSVNCCKNKYEEFLQSPYNVYKGYPLKKECGGKRSWRCKYNPSNESQKEFDREGAKDFSNLY